jgi:hypothetical protein
MQERNVLADTHRRDEAIEPPDRNPLTSRTSMQSRGPAKVVEALEPQNLERGQPALPAANIGLGAQTLENPPSGSHR